MTNERYEYTQTYQARSTVPKAPVAINAPQGDGWTLHSWQADPGTDFLILIWQRAN